MSCSSSSLFLTHASQCCHNHCRKYPKAWTGLKFAQSQSTLIANVSKSTPWQTDKLALHEKNSKHDFAIQTMLADDSVMKSMEQDTENLGIFSVDPSLVPFKVHFSYRFKRYMDQKALIEKYEGSLEEFAQGYLKFGFNREGDSIVYREWAPAAQEAQLVGDFNGWNGSNHKMQRNEFGVWTIRIPDSGDKPAIPHNSNVKFRFKHGNRIWVDRIPAWIRYATVDNKQFAAPYDGVYWDPPPSERYEFKYPRPPKPVAPRIYEAHVGMSSSEPRINSYREFADDVLPRIKANNYNAVQLMAVMEHSYYASFGYHVTNFFAVSSRSGTPEDLKYLIDKAHSLGLRVLMDVVHSHASNNVTDGLNGFDVGQRTEESYFHTGERGYHKLWDSRLFNYANWEVLRFFLSNLRWWLDEFMFDGFRFDGVTSMLYHHHGINTPFSGNYGEYFSQATDVDAVVYMMLANTLVHSLLPDATVIAEDVSGMPGLCLPVNEVGVGFDYRLAMAIPDKWIDHLKNKKDIDWSMEEIVCSLTNRRYTEKCVAYAESHDQAIVGDKSIAFLLMDKEMYSGMSDLEPASPVIERGISLHKMIHFITMALGGEGYLNFMGNEFGHPEWIDFPRDGNSWSYDKCRRQWNLVDTDHLRYKHMNAFDRAMNLLDDRFSFLASTKQIVSSMDEKDKVIVFERGDLVFVFNFHPENSYDGYKVGCDLPGKYRVALDSDALEFGGLGRIGNDVDHFTSPEGIPGVPETNFNNRPNSFKVLAPSRTCVVFYRVEEDLLEENNAEDDPTRVAEVIAITNENPDMVDAKENLTKVAEVITITNENPDMVDAKENLTKAAEVIAITNENPDMVDAKEDLTKVTELIAIINENPDMVITKEDLTKVAEVIAIINENPDMVVTREDLTKVAEVIAIINENRDMINTKKDLSKVAEVIAIINENADMINTKEDLTKVAEVIAFTDKNPDIVDTKEDLTKVAEVIAITNENPTGFTESIVATKDPSGAIIAKVTESIVTKVAEVIAFTDKNPTGVTESIVATKDPSGAIIDTVITEEHK